MANGVYVPNRTIEVL